MADGTPSTFVTVLELNSRYRYIVRREPAGPVYDREEPNTREIHFPLNALTEGGPHDSSATALEGLYTHFQFEKYSSESDLLYTSAHAKW
jgi:hypothetical protein